MTCHETRCGNPENCPCEQHPAASDEVTILGMVHIQKCPLCRERFGVWAPGFVAMLDTAQAIEDAK